VATCREPEAVVSQVVDGLVVSVAAVFGEDEGKGESE
jgi:hypothetical protein